MDVIDVCFTEFKSSIQATSFFQLFPLHDNFLTQLEKKSFLNNSNLSKKLIDILDITVTLCNIWKNEQQDLLIGTDKDVDHLLQVLNFFLSTNFLKLKLCFNRFLITILLFCFKYFMV
jgi:hypothetical protein